MQKQKSCTPSLILAPPTITDHWFNEIKKFLDEKTVRSVVLNAKIFKENS